MEKFLGKKLEAPKPSKKTDVSRSVPPSKQKVKCNYPGCGFYGIRYSLNRHMQRRHKDECGKVKPVWLAGGFAPGYFQVSQQPSVSLEQGIVYWFQVFMCMGESAIVTPLK